MPENPIRKAADEQFLRHYDLVVRTARLVAPTAESAGDVVQQAYIEFIRGALAGKWTFEEDTAPLLYRITRLIALRVWQQRRAHTSEQVLKLEEYLKRRLERQENAASEEAEEHRKKMARVNHCIDRLPDKSRQLIDMRYFVEMSIPEIAETMQLTEKNTQQILRRIRERIRRCVEQLLNEE